MPLPGRTFARDEELGKKDDDHRPVNGTIPVPSWSWVTSKPTPRMRRRRVFYGLVAVLLLYLFVKNVPTDLGPVSQRLDTRVPGQTLAGVPLSYSDAPTGQPPHAGAKSKSENHYYDGQIKFPYLAATLFGIARTMGYRELNRNVLFSAANLQSAARLIPMACEMSRWNRNIVHFAIMGRDDISLQDIRTVNGVGAECDIYWHGGNRTSYFMKPTNRSWQMLGQTTLPGVPTSGWKSVWARPWDISVVLCIHRSILSMVLARKKLSL